MSEIIALRQPNNYFRSVVVDGRAVAESVRFLREDFGRLVKYAALDAKHNCGIVDGIGGHGHRLVDDAGTVGAVGHFDNVGLTGEDGLLRPGRDSAAAT